MERVGGYGPSDESSILSSPTNAPVAQRIEQQISNLRVASLILAGSTN